MKNLLIALLGLVVACADTGVGEFNLVGMRGQVDASGCGRDCGVHVDEGKRHRDSGSNGLPSDAGQNRLDAGSPVGPRDAGPPTPGVDSGKPGAAAGAGMDAQIETPPDDASPRHDHDPSAIDGSMCLATTNEAGHDTDLGSDDSGADCMSGDACDGGDVCIDGNCMLDPGTSEWLWVRVWRWWWEPNLPIGAGQIIVAGPDQRIHFTTSCYEDIPGLRCAFSSGEYVLNHVNRDGVDQVSFRLDWSAAGVRGAYGVDSMGRVVVGYYYQRFDNALSGPLGYVRSHSPAGDPYWEFRSGLGGSMVENLVVDPSGQISFQGALNAEPSLGVDYGGGPTAGRVLVRFDRDGAFQWQRALPPSGEQWWMWAGPAGELVGVTDSVDVLTALACTPPNGQWATALVKLDASGACLWVRGISLAGETAVRLSVHHDTGDIFLAFLSGELADFGAGELPALSEQDLVLARLSPDGVARWSQRRTATAAIGIRIAVGDNGEMLLAGAMDAGALDLGRGEVLQVQPSHFLARFGVHGQLLGYRFIARPEGRAAPLPLAADDEGNAVIAVEGDQLDLGIGEETVIHEASGTGDPTLEYVALRLAKLRLGAAPP